MNQTTLNAGKFQRKAVQVDEAQRIIANHVKQGEREEVGLEQAHGRYLAMNLTAPHPYPRFRRSGMDGYAILGSDTEVCSSGQEIWLRVVDEIPCGTVSDKRVETGLAARIMTGAQLPEGADTVVMLEATQLREEEGQTYVGLKKRMEIGKNVTQIGHEIQEGQLLLSKGTCLGAGHISVLATFGVHRVPVYRKPRVAVFSTGSELLAVDESLQPGKIRNSNTYMLASQIREAGGEPFILQAIHDELDVARASVREAIAAYDIVVTSGGVSVGDYDIMGDLVRQEDVDMLFNKVTMRPGSVTTAAVIDGKLLFALSGNPGACFVGCELFVRPTIQMMLSSEQPYLQTWTVLLGADYTKVNNFTRFVRSSLEIRDGQVYAIPARADESSVMVTIKDSDCLIVLPPTTDGLRAGEEVRVLVLQGGKIK
ncbi:molybdopterin molybdotransferase MoeA [Paenibacillus brasilensis]|uniref:Molybdopterin molybdenumtransferase n=1 Tax=Paenibacillus brasilensis TaxID=128574 RepID=A0ABU0KY32_9BACL|nr:gephyrin-like molybdotransferase Glp [Paenibacillus brasilensis]MDQ0493286.1 molybdopterin molybdotransferase [Paenibacillus brasilensis]